MVATLKAEWEYLRRFRGTPPASAPLYFHPDCQVLYIATGQSYAGLSQVEQLFAELRRTFMYVENVEVISTAYGEASGTVTEESVWTIRHNTNMEWLAPGLRESGEMIKLLICTVSEIREGKIKNQRIYWDNAYVLRTLKALPQSVTSRGKQIVLRTATPAVVDQAIAAIDGASVDVPEQEPEVHSPALARRVEPQAASGLVGGAPSTPPVMAASQPGTTTKQEFPTTGGKRTSTRLYGKPPGGQSSISFG
ncbi:hypothetical protein HDV00_002932 [Rhizophlyctis rosea]|nr:hypothetical protein HDV00_002932 [Rhizophlyctis rosea]